MTRVRLISFALMFFNSIFAAAATARSIAICPVGILKPKAEGDAIHTNIIVQDGSHAAAHRPRI